MKKPGIGIPAQFHEAIFEMFRRRVSAPGQGSTFYFTLGEEPR